MFCLERRRADDSFHAATTGHEEHWTQMTSRGNEVIIENRPKLGSVAKDCIKSSLF